MEHEGYLVPKLKSRNTKKTILSKCDRQVQALTTSVQELTRQNQIAHATAYQNVNGQRKS